MGLKVENAQLDFFINVNIENTLPVSSKFPSKLSMRIKIALLTQIYFPRGYR